MISFGKPRDRERERERDRDRERERERERDCTKAYEKSNLFDIKLIKIQNE